MSHLSSLSLTRPRFGMIQGIIAIHLALELLSDYCFCLKVVDRILMLVSEFKDIFDVDHFITSLRDEVRILKELPPRLKRRVELGVYHTMPPISWSNMSYYQDQVR